MHAYTLIYIYIYMYTCVYIYIYIYIYIHIHTHICYTLMPILVVFASGGHRDVLCVECRSSFESLVHYIVIHKV